MTSKLLGLFLDVENKPENPDSKVTSQADELIKQIGENASAPDDIPSALNGFNFTYQTADGEVNKQYEFSDSE
ncbi:hypothetical protein [Halorubrum sp. PV6]|uniref:hypothetical protein n=1 Tax=Halorubrum sp. PV6 TaxID=634157 RepID=UPI001444C1D9|nr:hypothetical protein [Halorubrum sp. PV6]